MNAYDVDAKNLNVTSYSSLLTTCYNERIHQRIWLVQVDLKQGRYEVFIHGNVAAKFKLNVFGIKIF